MSDPGLVQISTKDGFPMRVLVLGQTTRLEWQVELESSTSVTLSAVTFELARGETTKAYSLAGATITVSGADITVDVSNTDLVTTLTSNELDILQGSLTVTISGESNVQHFQEDLFVSRCNVACPVRTSHILNEYPELQKATSYPIDPLTGSRQTTWAPQLRLAWMDVLVDLYAMGGVTKYPLMVTSNPVLTPLVKAAFVKVLARVQITLFQTDIWKWHLARAEKDYDRLMSTLKPTYAQGSRTRFGVEPIKERVPLREPMLLVGNPRDSDFGKW